MDINLILPFFSAAIMLAFTFFVLQRYAVRRKLHFLFWGLGLGMFGLGSFAEAYLALSWNRWVFFMWYFCGAVLNAAWIGHGTAYLLFRKKWVHAATGILILASLAALGLMLNIMPRLDATAFTTTLPVSQQYSAIMPAIKDGGWVRLSTPFFNIYGVFALAGGAIWSAYLFWRKRILPNRVVANVLIAAGALSIAFAGTLTRLGYGSLLYLGELVAAILMFGGFLLAARPESAEQPLPAAQPH